MKLLFISLTVLSILSQVAHAYYAFNKFSRLKGAFKKLQSIAFCSIISVAIFAFVWINKPMLALFGAGIEIIINIYYYSEEFWDNGYGQKKNKLSHTLIWWRKYWAKILFGILMPFLIYIFSMQLIDYK